MSFIEPKSEDSYPWYVRWIFSAQKKRYGNVLEPAKIWGRSPRVFLAVSHLYRALDRKNSPLDQVLRSLVAVRVSQINSCSHCVDINSANVIKRGGSGDKLKELPDFRRSSLYTPVERTALRYAEAITYTDGEISEELRKTLREMFAPDQIVELTALVVFQNMSSKFNSAMKITSQNFCSL